jgi:hypothetical protein
MLPEIFGAKQRRFTGILLAGFTGFADFALSSIL